MIIVKEKKRENKSIFEIQTYDNNNKLILSETLDYETNIVERYNGFTYLVLYDVDMKPFPEIFSYLNITLTNLSVNSRIKALNALRLLYVFQRIICKNVAEFNVTDFNILKFFLRGVSPAGQVISFDLFTKRSNETINGYLSIYRQFLTHIGCSDSYLFKKSSRNYTIANITSDMRNSSDSYVSNEKNTKNQFRVPRYISVNDFRNILMEIRDNYTLCEECIVRLMFEGGLRLGEVLGLTFDDVVCEVQNSKKKFVVYIRNRASDNKDQNAKSCMKVANIKQYKSKDYNTKDYGYQLVEISEGLFNKTNEYIEEYHAYAVENKCTNYNKYAVADRVRKSEPYEGDNYYIFLNSLGKPLSYQTWNNTLRQIFTAVGIPIDKNVREHNLSHRFRHGFAMFNVLHMKANALQLQAKLRHKSLTSVSIYVRPTISDEIEIKTDFTNELYEIIPELKL